jgi:hypothetical protein
LFTVATDTGVTGKVKPARTNAVHIGDIKGEVLMKKLGSHKWLVAVGTVIVVVSLGAVACDASGNDQAAANQIGASGNTMQAPGGNVGMSNKGAVMADRRQAMKERREARAERHQALVESVRDKMSASDQALFDQLSASVEQQRAAAQQARQKLADTLKELRTLVDKYLDMNETGTD